jgi:ABC-2 type transport system ATP-binding protein
MHALECEQLTKVYRSGLRNKREIRALQEVSISVESGQIFSLLGPSGQEKRPCKSASHPTGGRMVLTALSRVPCAPASDTCRKPPFPGYLTGEQVMTSFGSLAGVDRSALPGRIDQLLTLVGMQKWRKVKVRKYSKGMMQRLDLREAVERSEARLPR